MISPELKETVNGPWGALTITSHKQAILGALTADIDSTLKSCYEVINNTPV